MTGNLNGIRNQGPASTFYRGQRAGKVAQETTSNTDQVQLSSAGQVGPTAAGSTESRPGKVRNLALQVATALVFGCAGLALVGCGVNSEVDSLKIATTQLSQQGGLKTSVCEKVSRQVGPDWLPFSSKVVECEEKPVSPEEAARLLAKGKEVHLLRYLPGDGGVQTGESQSGVVSGILVRDTMKSAADAFALQGRLAQAESR